MPHHIRKALRQDSKRGAEKVPGMGPEDSGRVREPPRAWCCTALPQAAQQGLTCQEGDDDDDEEEEEEEEDEVIGRERQRSFIDNQEVTGEREGGREGEREREGRLVF